MAETVKVIVRCRPMNARERDLKCGEVLKIDGPTAQCAIRNPDDKSAPPKNFTFDGAYDLNSTTEQIYADIGFPLVEGVTEGYNGTIFAYGQTGSGKSFSMQGITDPSSQRGIIPRAFDHVFETIQVTEGSKFLVHASYLEIYNEEVRDLLGKDTKQKLDLKEHPDKGVYIPGLSKNMCKNVRECEVVMDRGWKNRATGATLMNADSSRSHSIFTIHLERSETDAKGEAHIRGAKLNLVDLAGSERQSKTGATGDRFKEATKINLSLSALGNVISALVDGKSTHIPYRDSKLTRLLQDSLGGNTKTLMVACLSPADNNYEETLSTLRYANRAKNIKNKPKINEDPKDALIREFQNEINRLKAMLSGEIQGGTSAQKAPAQKGFNREEIEEEKKKIREEYNKELKSYKDELLTVKASKDESEQQLKELRLAYEKKLANVDLNTQNDNVSDRELIEDGEKETNLQHAVHLSTKKIGKRGAGDKQSQSDPASSLPVGDKEEAEKRLRELEQTMVGGEQSNNKELKERRKKRSKFAEDREKKLKELLLKMDGDEIMFNLYEDYNDKLRSQTNKVNKEKIKNESLNREIKDLAAEFEFDRIDYLDKIREQEKEIQWLKKVVERIQPVVRRDCNFYNLDRIKTESKWDDVNREWTIPKLTITETQLPGGSLNGGDIDEAAEYNPYNMPNQSFNRLEQKLQASDHRQSVNSHFGQSRATELLQNSDRQRGAGRYSLGSQSYSSSQLNGDYSSSISSLSKNSSSPAISDEAIVRKPQQLEPLFGKQERKTRKL